jgi:hypothetical protein
MKSRLVGAEINLPIHFPKKLSHETLLGVHYLQRSIRACGDGGETFELLE